MDLKLFDSGTQECTAGIVTNLSDNNGMELKVCSGIPTERIFYSENQSWFAKELSSGVIDEISKYNGVGDDRTDKLVDGDRSTYAHTISGCGERQCNLFISLTRSYNVTRVDVIARQQNHLTYDRYEYIEVRCLKPTSKSSSQLFSVCDSEAIYDSNEVEARNMVLPFHCDDECVGVEVYQGDTVTTHYAEVEIYGCQTTTEDNNGFPLDLESWQETSLGYYVHISDYKMSLEDAASYKM